MQKRVTFARAPLQSQPQPPPPPPPLKIVLIHGWSSAGKDTLGRYLINHHKFQRFAFADLVKESASNLYGFDRHLADSEEGKRSLHSNGHTIRELIIATGEAYRNTEGNGFWAEKLAHFILALPACPRRIVITDWRFPEELVTFQAMFPAAQIYPLRVVREGQRVSPVASMTEYSLSGFPMPQFNAVATDQTPLCSYIGLKR